jgi:hypothetical protein
MAVWPMPASAASITDARVINWGGGHMTAMSAEPGSNGDRLLAAGDVAGVQWSVDAGYTWHPQNDGLADGQTSVAAIAWSATDPTRAWMAYGATTIDDQEHRHESGGIATATVLEGQTLLPWATLGRPPPPAARCEDYGQDDASDLRFQGVKSKGDNSADPLGRAVGNLLADDGAGHLYAGTLHGVFRSVADPTHGFALGDCWTRIWGDDDTAIRSLIADPNQPAAKLYVGTNADGVWRLDNPAGALIAKHFTNYAGPAEELAFNLANTTLYCACGPNGVWTSTTPRSMAPSLAAFNDRAGAADIECSATGVGCTVYADHIQWYSAIVPVTNGLWVATSDPFCPEPQVTAPCHALFRYAANTDTWTAAPANVDPTILGSCNPNPCPTWWLSEFQNARMLGWNDDGHSLFIPTGMVSYGTTVMLSGTGGVWHASALGSGATWQPTSLGLGLTIIRADAFGPSGDVYIGDQDHAFLGFDPDTKTIKSSTSSSPPQAVGSFAVAADPQIVPDDRVFLGVSPPTCVTGCTDDSALYWKDNPMGTDPGGWNRLALPAGAMFNRPVGLTAGAPDTNNCSGQPGQMDLLVAVAQNGLWRYQGCGDEIDNYWTAMGGPPFDVVCSASHDDRSNIKSPIVWPEPATNTTYAYVLDRCTRAVNRLNLVTSTFGLQVRPGLLTSKTTGFMAGQPGAETTLWLTQDGRQGSVERLRNTDAAKAEDVKVKPFSLSTNSHWDNAGLHQVAGPIAVTHAGHAYVLAVDTDPPQGGATRTSVGVYEIADDVISWVGNLALPGAAVQAQDLAVACPQPGDDGHLYVATQGDGVIDVSISSC